MARLITKFKYMKAGDQQTEKSSKAGGYAKYIATREGVEKIDDLFMFEAPIDMLSFISMHSHQNWKQHTYAAACCVSDKVLFECLKNNPQIKNVYLCLDNDQAGQAANQRIYQKLAQMNINTKVLIPHGKDWNEDLLILNGRNDSICQAVQS